MESENPLSASYRPLAQKGYWPALALELFAEGRYAKAVDLCDRMLEQEPGVISGRVILARSLFHAGQFERARIQFVEVLKRDPKNLLALKYLGDIHYRDGEEAAAMACYRRIFEIDPHTRGVSSPVEKKEVVQTRELTVKRPEETVGGKKPQPLQEPAFVTETVGDIYREQGYFMLAGEVYRRLLVGTDNSRIAAKLKEVEDKISIKEK